MPEEPTSAELIMNTTVLTHCRVCASWSFHSAMMITYMEPPKPSPELHRATTSGPWWKREEGRTRQRRGPHFQQNAHQFAVTLRFQEQIISISKSPHSPQDVIQVPYSRPHVIWTLKIPSQCFIASLITLQSEWTTFATYTFSCTDPQLVRS